jgi:hypothetical protein
MSEKSTVTCDVCGIDRAECNGWFSYRLDEREFHAGHADGKKGRFHACGHLCLHKALDAYIVSQKVTSPVPDPLPQAKQELPAKEEPESLVRGKGLTVESLVAEQGGNPEKAVYEGSVPVVIDGETRLVAVYNPLPCDPGEEANIPVKESEPVDDRKIEMFEEIIQPKEKE